MRRIPYLLAAAAISGFALSATPGIASPLAGGLTSENVTVPEASEGFVQKVHGWHCRARKGWFRGHRYWHRHRRACYGRYHHPGFFFGTPFVGFSFGFPHRHRHYHWRRHHWDWD